MVTEGALAAYAEVHLSGRHCTVAVSITFRLDVARSFAFRISSQPVSARMMRCQWRSYSRTQEHAISRLQLAQLPYTIIPQQ